jgi:hypothetical protein
MAKVKYKKELNHDSRVVRVHSDLACCGIANQPVGVGEYNIRRGGAVTLVIGDDRNTRR